MSQKVIIGSTNPVKIQCVEKAFSQVFPDVNWIFEGAKTDSGVSDQPMSDGETYRGAQNRARAAKSQVPDASFWIGIEGGIEDVGQGQLMEAFAWMVVLHKEQSSRARTATFPIPEEVAQLVRDGVELGIADDKVFGRSNSKQKDGAVGLLTNGLIDRTQYYEHAVILALVPFLKREHFSKLQLPG